MPARPSRPRHAPAGPPRAGDGRTCAASATGSGGRTSSCWPGRGRLSQPLPAGSARANLAGTKGVPRFTQALLAEHAEGLVALSGCRDGEIARRLLAGDRDRAPGRRRAVRRALARAVPRRASRAPGSSWSCQHHLLPDDDWLVAGAGGLAGELGPAGRRHQRRPLRAPGGPRAAGRAGRPSATAGRSRRCADLRRRAASHYLKSRPELAALPPGRPGATPIRSRGAWRGGHRAAGELAARCQVDLGFERYRFPGFPVPGGETPFSYLARALPRRLRAGATTP